MRARTSRRRLLADRAARWGVTGGGLVIIAAILGILVFIALEVLPLARPARVTPAARIPAPAGALGALVVDEYRSRLVGLGGDGVVRTWSGTGGLVDERPLPGAEGGSIVGVQPVPGSPALSAATADGRVVLVPVVFETRFEEGTRSVESSLGEHVVLEVDPARRGIEAFAARLDGSGSATAAAVLADGSLELARREVEENAITGEITESVSRRTLFSPVRPAHLLLPDSGTELFAGTAAGELAWWSLGDEPGPPQVVAAGGGGVTALSFLLGERSLAVGTADGGLSVWFPVRGEDGRSRLTRIRDFPDLPGAVSLLAPSTRDRSFLAGDASGHLALLHSTSHRVLWSGRSPVHGATAMVYAPKADGAVVAGHGGVVSLDLANRHPEASWEALFGRVWYEGYPGPAHVWQSSGGTDDFEPKLSLTPLLVGTLKGTFYSLLLAIPLGVFGAMYASQFMHPRLQRYVKPTVEIMAALPSVVLGFLAGLWLAPRLERAFAGLALMLVVLPLAVLGAGWLFRALPRRLRQRLVPGAEVGLYVLALLAGMALCLALSRPVEAGLFGGSFQDWLRQATGLGYDQRNAVVVGLAMGFAVIPIIFAISEDAFTNVPRNLVSGSLALGATRWQTVTRVVLPTASPGIFSAVMVGFGRAVGETMIVLMATGNTPIMDWNPFNGFRTLSANIAVEIAEAPQGGTLYRTLFLAAFLLFLLTFVINTLAEIVRQRLRRRYATL